MFWSAAVDLLVSITVPLYILVCSGARTWPSIVFDFWVIMCFLRLRVYLEKLGMAQRVEESLLSNLWLWNINIIQKWWCNIFYSSSLSLVMDTDALISAQLLPRCQWCQTHWRYRDVVINMWHHNWSQHILLLHIYLVESRQSRKKIYAL